MNHLKLPLAIIGLSAILTGCFNTSRNCEQCKTGKFSFSTEVGGRIETSTFVRFNDYEVEYFQGKSDTSNIRWINDCEYILQKRNPKNRAEQQAIHIKITKTDEMGYEFDYKAVGDEKTLKGRVNRVN